MLFRTKCYSVRKGDSYYEAIKNKGKHHTWYGCGRNAERTGRTRWPLFQSIYKSCVEEILGKRTGKEYG